MKKRFLSLLIRCTCAVALKMGEGELKTIRMCAEFRGGNVVDLLPIRTEGVYIYIYIHIFRFSFNEFTMPAFDYDPASTISM